MEYTAVFGARNDFPTEVLFSVCIEPICFRADFSLYAAAGQAGLVGGYAYQMPVVPQFSNFFKSHIDLYHLPRYPQLADFNEKTG